MLHRYSFLIDLKAEGCHYDFRIRYYIRVIVHSSEGKGISSHLNIYPCPNGIWCIVL
jgi:hypothetical protein